MRRVGGDLNRILVAVNLLFENVRGHLCLAQETLRYAAADVNDSGYACANGDLRHVEHVLHVVELKVVLLFETSTRDPNSNSAVGEPRTKHRTPRLVSCRQHAIFRGDLREFAAEQMQELTC